MSLVEREITSARVEASQANGKKSKGPNTPEGKARVALNALKTGVYARSENAQREILLRRGENPQDFEQLHHGLTEEWQPEYTTEALLVKSIAEKSFDKANLRAAWMESQLGDLRIAEIQAQRQRLLMRRLLPSRGPAHPWQPPLWQDEDSPTKFHRIFSILDTLERWCRQRERHRDLSELLYELYRREDHTRAGARIDDLFACLFGKDPAAAAKAQAELLGWIAQERKDVEQERDLFRRQSEIEANAGPRLSEEEVSRKEATLERQIRDDTRLLLQLKAARSKREGSGPAKEAPAAADARRSEPRTSESGTESVTGMASESAVTADACRSEPRTSETGTESITGMASEDSVAADAAAESGLDNALPGQETAFSGVVAPQNENLPGTNLVTSLYSSP